VPALLETVQPLHVHVKVDQYIHGCPPSAKRIREALEALLNREPTYAASTAKFG